MRLIGSMDLDSSMIYISKIDFLNSRLFDEKAQHRRWKGIQRPTLE